jgi:hypothetical protein
MGDGLDSMEKLQSVAWGMQQEMMTRRSWDIWPKETTISYPERTSHLVKTGRYIANLPLVSTTTT